MPAALSASIMRRRVVLVLVDKLDLAVARAVQYARSMGADEVRAVHFVLEEQHAEALAESWERLVEDLPLELIECPDRRLTNCALVMVTHVLADGETDVTVLVPDRIYSGAWGRFLHDQTGPTSPRRSPDCPMPTSPPFRTTSALPILCRARTTAPSATTRTRAAARANSPVVDRASEGVPGSAVLGASSKA